MWGESKTLLRQTVRLRLKTLSLEARAEKSAAICRALAQTEEWRQARNVGFFSPLASEPDIDLLWAVLGERTVCYPRIHGERLLFLQVPNRAALLESRWNLREPAHQEDRVAPLGGIDLLLVPGLAFTADGHRLGRGGGFYDRLLSDETLRATTFGVCFAEQLVPRLPMEVHDRPVRRVFAA